MCIFVDSFIVQTCGYVIVSDLITIHQEEGKKASLLPKFMSYGGLLNIYLYFFIEYRYL